MALEIEITKIAFGGMGHQALVEKIEDMFKSYMKQFKFDHLLTYDVDEKVLLIELENKKDFEQLNSYISQNIDSFNKGVTDV